MAAATRCNLESRWQAVRAEMERNAYHLMRRGSIVAKWASGGRRWVLRFSALDSQGRAVHRSLYLGSDDAAEVLHRARELLRHYREQANHLEEIRLFARFSAKAAGILLRPGCSRGAGRKRAKS
jgi:hypothetical protein